MPGRPLNMAIICCTNMLPNKVNRTLTITATPTRLTIEATPRFQPWATSATTNGSMASATNSEMMMSSTR